MTQLEKFVLVKNHYILFDWLIRLCYSTWLMPVANFDNLSETQVSNAESGSTR